jgi:hypothetical protein
MGVCPFLTKTFRAYYNRGIITKAELVQNRYGIRGVLDFLGGEVRGEKGKACRLKKVEGVLFSWLGVNASREGWV